MNEAFFNDLNAAQADAVRYCDGAQLVIAGAGSGKTRVLTYKIAYLLEQGMNAHNILALTFTNKAANEMKQRISQLVDAECARRLNMGTFHSVFCRILRTEAAILGFGSNFTIYDESDSKSLIGAIMKDLDIDTKTIKPASVKSVISMAKNRLEPIGEYVFSRRLHSDEEINWSKAVVDVCEEYTVRCKNANAMDFDDLLVNTYILFNTYPDILQKYASRFQYILVDEYQDTNFVQQKIVSMLAKWHKHVCMVGDDAQSIYSFRGANLDYMLNFQSNHDFRIFKLEQNYRSTQNIVNAANSLIKHNQRQIHKDVFSNKNAGEPLIFKSTISDREEASVVCRDIIRLHKSEHCGYSDIAILYRTNAQSRSLEEEFRRNEIPYRIYGGLSFYQRKEIKDVIAYMRLVVNSSDDEALRRIINYPARGIGATTLQKLSAAAAQSGVCMYEMLSPERIAQLPISKTTVGKLSAFRALIDRFVAESAEMSAYDIGKNIVEKSGIAADIIADKSVEGEAKKQNIDELSAALKSFVDSKMADGETDCRIQDFLQEVSLLSDQDTDDGTSDAVSLMTIHSSKGLEFQSVFIVGLEENIFPSPRSLDSSRAIEEERRLFYVAITRAKEHCFLTCAQSRYRYGKLEFSSPSRFLKDIAPEYIRVEHKSLFNQNRSYSSTPSLFPKSGIATLKLDTVETPAKHRMIRIDPAPASEQRTSAAEYGIRNGSVIEHQRFGRGIVKRIEGSGENAKATVEFSMSGTKQLLLKFARFTVIQQ